MHLTDIKFSSIFPFEKPRHNQREIIEQILTAFEKGKRYVILNAPTGIGKSAIGYAVARYYGNGTILTSQKILQEQYYKDFEIPFVLGRANYTCLRNQTLTCEMGMCFKIASKMCKDSTTKDVICPYIIARDNCLNADYSNLNYSYYLSFYGNDTKEGDVPAGFKKVLVMDECHALEQELLSQYSVKLDPLTLKFIGCTDAKIPDKRVSDAEKCRWLTNEMYESARSTFLYLSSNLKSLSKLKSTKEYKKLASRYSTLGTILNAISMIKSVYEEGETIIVTHEDDKIEYKMLHCDKLFDKCMGKRADHFLFMSATVLNYKSFIKDIGLNEKYVEYIECDSVFPVENRLIHYAPVGSMSYKNKAETIPKLIKEIDHILKENKDVKGIIHTVSYDTAEKIMEGLAFSDQHERLLMPRGSSKNLTLEVFYNSDKPYVLISPAIMEGIDLKDDLSRLCIVCKVPYANLGDKWTKTRMDEDKEWYITAACMNLVQMSGRSIRSDTDFAKTYILDADFMRLAKDSVHIFPKWWQNAVIVDHT